jgi:hypothetical protein
VCVCVCVFLVGSTVCLTFVYLGCSVPLAGCKGEQDYPLHERQQGLSTVRFLQHRLPGQHLPVNQVHEQSVRVYISRALHSAIQRSLRDARPTAPALSCTLLSTVARISFDAADYPHSVAPHPPHSLDFLPVLLVYCFLVLGIVARLSLASASLTH